MSWILLLGIVVVFVALVALTGIKPSGTRRVSSTRMMTAARVALVVMAIFLVVALIQGS